MVPDWANKPSDWAKGIVDRMMADDQKTAGSDPELADRAEKLKQELSGF